jgi:hypothetical protein
VCGCCHLPFMTIMINGHYCYNYKNIITIENLTCISCKIKQSTLVMSLNVFFLALGLSDCSIMNQSTLKTLDRSKVFPMFFLR